jgi:uncharacterized membrane protein
MTSFAWAMMLIVTLHALMFHAMPRFSRPDILFAVTVPEAFVVGAGRTLVSRYRLIVWSGAAVTLAIGLLLPASLFGAERAGFVMMAVMAGNMLVAGSAWLWAHRRARAHTVPDSETRVASLVPRDTSLPGGALFAGGPFVILVATAVVVWMHWDQFPPRPRPLGPFGPLAMGGVYVAMMLTLAMSLARRTRQISADGLAAAAEQRFLRVNVFVLVLAGYGTAVMLSTVALDPIPSFAGMSSKIWLAMLPIMLFNFGVAVWMLRVGQGGQRAVSPAARDVGGDATPDRAWKAGGLFYFNPKDPAIWVEKRVGFGYTLNMGNVGAWVLISMMLVPAIAARLFF